MHLKVSRWIRVLLKSWPQEHHSNPFQYTPAQPSRECTKETGPLAVTVPSAAIRERMEAEQAAKVMGESQAEELGFKSQPEVPQLAFLLAFLNPCPTGHDGSKGWAGAHTGGIERTCLALGELPRQPGRWPLLALAYRDG